MRDEDIVAAELREAAATAAAAPTDIAAQFAVLINQLSTTLKPAAAPPPPPPTPDERTGYNVHDAKGFLQPRFSHYPAEERGDRPGPFNRHLERTAQYLTDNKKLAAAEEYTWAYASALFQCSADQALEAYLGSSLELPENAEDRKLLRPLLDLIHRNAECALQRLTLLRIVGVYSSLPCGKELRGPGCCAGP